MRKEYLFLNLFRATAAYWVLVSHCMIWGGWYLPLVPPPKLAVDLFMMISGFLMASHAEARSVQEPLDRFGNWVRFWMRRFFRIAPAYYVSLAVAVILGASFLGGYQAWIDLNPDRWRGVTVYDPGRIENTPASILAHITFFFGFHPTLSFSTFLPDWSLALEMQFYALFPLLWLIFRRFGPGPAALALGLAALAGKALLAKFVLFYEPSLIVLKLPCFLAGMLLFEVVQPSRPGAKRIALLVLGAALVSTESTYGAWVMLLPALLLSMAVIGSLELSSRLPRPIWRMLDARIVHFASETSYGLYLFHGFFISAGGLLVAASPALLGLGGVERVAALIVFVVAGTVSVAAIIRRFVERPGIAFGRSVMDRLAPAEPSSASATLSG